jgi:inosine-uridine nucleoside N-ribohydrolase
MNFPTIPEETRVRSLIPPTGKVTVVLDTDTYNEVDDQFALAYALLSPEVVSLEAIYAAPFLNSRASSPADGMERSYQEIQRVIERMQTSSPPPIHRGSTDYLMDEETAQESEAARDLVTRANAAKETLYVVAIGAITNVASAILMDPSIISKIVVVWLGGALVHPLTYTRVQSGAGYPGGARRVWMRRSGRARPVPRGNHPSRDNRSGT